MNRKKVVYIVGLELRNEGDWTVSAAFTSARLAAQHLANMRELDPTSDYFVTTTELNPWKKEPNE